MIGWATNRWHSIWHAGLRRRSVSALIFTIPCVCIATAVRLGLGFISPDSAVFAPYYSATLVAALVGGAEAGALAAVLGGIAAYWLFVPPDWDLASFRLEQLVSLVLYGTSSVVITWAAESYRSLLQRLRHEEVTRQLLNLELAHRIKNMLASVQAIIGHSLRDQEEVLETVRARLAALGATTDILVKSEQQTAALREILVRELAPYELSRCQLCGDDVDCPHALAVVLTLIFHELATNAVKYGSLSRPTGRIDIAWSIVAGQLALEWIENGGPPPPAAPTRDGFGSKLLRSGVRQFRGTVDCRFEPSGLQCRFSLRMPEAPNEAAIDLATRSGRNNTLISSAEMKVS